MNFCIAALVVVVMLLAAAANMIAAFTPVSRKHLTAGLPLLYSTQSSFPNRVSYVLPLFATRSVDDFNNNDDDDDNNKKQDYDAEKLRRDLQELEQSMNTKYRGRGTRAVGPGRAGGRTRKPKPLSSPPTNNNNLWNSWVIKAGVPVLAIALLLKTIFGGDNGGGSASNPSYFYYQSSYYESRVYSGDGNMQRTYKQSIKSNVPSLIEGQRLLRQQQQDDSLSRSSDESRPSQSLLRQSYPDSELDAALVRVQQAMFSDWY